MHGRLSWLHVCLPLEANAAHAIIPLHQVLLLDELTTFLDYEDQENVLQCVRSIVDSSGAAAAAGAAAAGEQQAALAGQPGVTALWVTHRLEELDYADSVRWVAGGGGSAAGKGLACMLNRLRSMHRLQQHWYCAADPAAATPCSYMDGGRIVFSGHPDEMRSYMRQLGALV